MLKQLFANLNTPTYLQDDSAYASTVKSSTIMLAGSLIAEALIELFVFRRPYAVITVIALVIVAIGTLASWYAFQRSIYWPNKLLPPLAAFAALNYILLLGDGIHDPAMVGFAAIASLLLTSETWYILLLTYGSLAIIAVSETMGLTKVPDIPQHSTWTDFLVAAGLLTIDIFVFDNLKKHLYTVYQRSIQSAEAQKQANAELQALKDSLEEQVTARTQDLQQAMEKLAQSARMEKERLHLYQGVANLARHIATQTGGEQKSDDFLQRVVFMVSNIFGFDHTGIFLMDKKQRYALLAAASSEGGQKMLARKHRLEVGQGIVGYAAKYHEERIVANVGDDKVFFDNPDLPETQAEAAFPLMVGDELLGVLDIQSNDPQTFTQDAIGVLKILADEIAVAIANQRLLEDLQTRLAELQNIYREQARESWRKLPKRLRATGYRYRPGRLEKLPVDAPVPALQNKAPHIETDEAQEETVFTAPIQFRGETLAALQIKTPAARAGEVAAQEDTLRAITERVALAIENARLYEETSRRAQREHLVARITARLRSTNDPEKLIETARQELKEALSAREVRIVPKRQSPTEASD